jgi:hypothetical protein
LRRRWLLALIAIAALAAAVVAVSRACDEGGGGDPLPSGVTPSAEPSRENTTEREGIRLHISVDRDAYEVGDEVEVRADVRNERDDSVNYVAPPGLPGFRLAVVSELGGEQQLELRGEAPPTQGALGAGNDLELEARWDQQLDLGDPVQAPEGKYTIQATFTFLLEGAPEPIDLRAVATFDLEGGEFIIDPRSVLELAVRNDEVNAWLAARGPLQNVSCAYPPTGLFYQAFLTNRTAAETLAFLYRDQLDKGYPICGIVTEGENWRLIFFARDGAEPKRMSAFIDLHSGEFLGFEEGGPEPTAPASP